MGKPYGHNYHFAGGGCSSGRMICAKCNQPVFNHAHDWVSYRKTFRDEHGALDWKYVTHHRACYADQSGWLKIEAEQRKEAERDKAIMTALNDVCAKFGATYGDLCLLMDEASQ
jgi:hypothetical protein